MNNPMTSGRIGIVIQGPLISTGRTGRTGRVPFRQVTQDDIVSFDCVDLITSLFERFNSRYEMVCVVWESDPEPRRQALRSRLPQGALHEIADDTRPIAAKGPIIPGNNKYRQFRSSLAGFEILKERGCTHVGKIRSDQDIDLDRLVYDYHQMGSDETVLVPRFIPEQPEIVADFYFIGQADLMIRLFSDYLEQPELFSSIHVDLFYCWARNLCGPPLLPLRLHDTALFDSYIRKLWFRLKPASRILYTGLVWRGEPIGMGGNRSVFLEDLRGGPAARLLRRPNFPLHRAFLREVRRIKLLRRLRRALRIGE